jgi:HAD superfamily hydrolase (TIGR01509 family)
MYRAVIFDVDGTLVDSNDAHAQAWVRALAEHGRRVDIARVRPLIGMGGDKLLPKVAGIAVDSPEGMAIDARRGEIFVREFLPTLAPTRGAQRLLEWLRDERMMLAVATSAQKSELEGLLRVAGAEKFIDAAATSDDAPHSKPDPDIVEAALNRTRCPRAETMMIGDTPYDIAAAQRAGIRIIALRCGGWDDRELAGATAIYSDPADLLEHYDLSPFTVPTAPLRSA